MIKKQLIVMMDKQKQTKQTPTNQATRNKPKIQKRDFFQFSTSRYF
jgi:hypothetical protein